MALLLLSLLQTLLSLPGKRGPARRLPARMSEVILSLTCESFGDLEVMQIKSTLSLTYQTNSTQLTKAVSTALPLLSPLFHSHVHTQHSQIKKHFVLGANCTCIFPCLFVFFLLLLICFVFLFVSRDFCALSHQFCIFYCLVLLVFILPHLFQVLFWCFSKYLP